MKRCLLNVVVGESPEHLLSHDNHQRYANRCGADHRVVVLPAKPPRPAVIKVCPQENYQHDCFFKFEASEIAKEYDQSLYLDNDTLVTRWAPCIFDFVPPGKFGFVDELNLLRPEFQCIRQNWFRLAWRLPGEPPHHDPSKRYVWWALNGGVLLLPQDAWRDYAYDSHIDHQFQNDQDTLSCKLARQPNRFVLLDRRFNHSWMHYTDWKHLSNAWIIHLAGLGHFLSAEQRLQNLHDLLLRFGL